MEDLRCSNDTIATVRDLIWLWADGDGKPYLNLSQDLGVADHQPRDWARRGSIPAEHIHPLVNAAQKRGFRAVTHELVTRLLAEAA